jgi:hypothetical protein
MSFTLDLSDSYRWPVAVDVPEDGRHKTMKFDGEFQRLPQDRINELYAAMQARLVAMQAGESTADLIDDREIADEVLIGWSGILDGDGDEVPYGQGVKTKLLNVPKVAASIVTAWGESLQGAKRKN